MSWDPESRKPQLELPRLLSSSPYVLPAPGDEWRVVMHWTPLRFTTHKRKDFYTKPVPKDHNSGKSLMFCNECRVPIQGPRFVCCDCQVAVNWCWACISNSKKAHPNGHVFVRIEKSSNSQDCIQKNLAAKSLVFRAKQKKKTHSKGNTVVQVTSEATHVVSISRARTVIDADVQVRCPVLASQQRGLSARRGGTSIDDCKDQL